MSDKSFLTIRIDHTLAKQFKIALLKHDISAQAVISAFVKQHVAENSGNKDE